MPTARLRADIAIHGRLDVTTEADLRAEMTALLNAQQSHGEDFVVDLAGVETVDMVGVGLLVGVHRQAGRCDRRLVLTGVPPPVLRLLTATRLRRVLTVRELPRVSSEQPSAGVVGAA
jgi:anti-anti-sigma factor